MRALVDGDILVYRCGFAAEHTIRTALDSSGVVLAQFDSAAALKEWQKDNPDIEFEVETHKEIEPLSHALANVKSVLSRIVDNTRPDETSVFLSQGECFRNEIATLKKYKGNRDDAPRPVYYKEIRDYLANNYGALTFNAVEADDVLALCQTDDSVIVSIDKDLLQVPGRHYNWVKEEKYFITPEVGIKKLYMQVLTGDATDNIPGIYRVGEATARKILTDVEPTKKALSDVCTQEWYDFIYNADGWEKLHPEAELDGNGYVYYPHWNTELPASERECRMSSEDLAIEIFKLVRVGGEDAKDAAHNSGEEIPYF